MGRASKKLEDYLPETVQALAEQLLSRDSQEPIALLGFGENLKWLSRLLADAERIIALFDDRPDFHGYDCGAHSVKPIDQILAFQPAVIALCHDRIDDAKHAALALADSAASTLPVLIANRSPQSPFELSAELSLLGQAAKARAHSVNSDDRLYNLVQAVRQTDRLKGSVFEIGTFSGGSAAIIAETLRESGSDRKLRLFDSFSGIPASPLGVDHRWTAQFTNVSLAEVKSRFSDLPFVRVQPGDVTETVPNIEEPLSLVHFDADTLHATRALVPCLWERLQPGGIILFDDFGFLPNCLPLTAWLERWSSDLPHAFVFSLPSNGLLIRKSG